jgi:hypothetical protein
MKNGARLQCTTMLALSQRIGLSAYSRKFDGRVQQAIPALRTQCPAQVFLGRLPVGKYAFVFSPPRRREGKSMFPPIRARLRPQPSFPEQGSQRSGQRGAIHREQFGQPFLSGPWNPIESLQQRELGNAQAAGTKRVIVEASDHPVRPAEIGTSARQENHGLLRYLRIAHRCIYIYRIFLCDQIDVYTSINAKETEAYE